MAPVVNTDFEKRIEDLKAEKQQIRDELRAAKTELKACRLLLRGREEVYHAVPSVVVVVREGRIEDVNNTVSEQLGYEPAELLGRDFLEIVAPDSRDRVREVHAKRLARKAVPEQYEAVLMTRDRRPFLCEVRVRKILMGRNRAFVVSLTPMDKRREREENRLRSKKMEAVLTMASALSGRLGRHCKALQDRIERLREAVSVDGEDVGPELQAIDAVAREAVETTDQLSTIARDRMDPSESRLFELKDVVREAVSLGRSSVEGDAQDPSPYQVKTYLRSGSRILGNPEELRDVLAHLVRNSLEAMPGGGNLYITSEELEGQAHLTIMDNGAGVPEQVMDRIFDPYFTTRGAKASGLGLSVAYAVIRRHGGKIEVTSEKGLGTELRVLIPAASPDVPSAGGRPGRSRRPERVLVIAVNQALRELLDRLFTARGWHVVTASSRTEGLARFQPQTYGGIILESRGRGHTQALSLCRKIKAGDGHVPLVLIADNGTPAWNPHQGGNWPFDLVVAKPLVMEEFQSRVIRLFMTA